MASAVDTQCFQANNFVKLYDHDPDGTSAAIVTPDAGTTEQTLDMSLFGEFTVVAMSSALTGNGITKLEIVASASSDMSSPEVIKDSGTVAADAVGDNVSESCNAKEVADIAASSGKALRYVAGRLTVANAADEAVVAYIGSKPRHPREDLTPATDLA